MLRDLDLASRMKYYEKGFALLKMVPGLPICCRIDGRNFSKYTASLKRPFDDRLVNLMLDTTKFLLSETDADIAYTQSDEISLIWKNESLNSEMFFGGKRDKIVSITASLATAYFNQYQTSYLPELAAKMPIFDSRVWQVPSVTEAINYLVWREQDATRNSIQMAARSVYSHNECFEKNTSDLQEMLYKKGINWNNYPEYFKRGSYIKKIREKRKFTIAEIEQLPTNHAAKKNPDLEVERRVILRLNIPPLTQVENREAVLF